MLKKIFYSLSTFFYQGILKSTTETMDSPQQNVNSKTI